MKLNPGDSVRGPVDNLSWQDTCRSYGHRSDKVFIVKRVVRSGDKKLPTWWNGDQITLDGIDYENFESRIFTLINSQSNSAIDGIHTIDWDEDGEDYTGLYAWRYVSPSWDIPRLPCKDISQYQEMEFENATGATFYGKYRDYQYSELFIQNNNRNRIVKFRIVEDYI